MSNVVKRKHGRKKTRINISVPYDLYEEMVKLGTGIGSKICWSHVATEAFRKAIDDAKEKEEREANKSPHYSTIIVSS